MIALFTAIPLAVAFLIMTATHRAARLAGLLANAACLVLAIVSVLLLGRLWGQDFSPIVYAVGGWRPPLGIAMVADALTCLDLLVVNLVALAAVFFSLPYMDQYTDKPKYYCLFMLMLAGTNGVAISGDMFNMFVFMEIGTIASAALVAFGTEQEELEASFRYLVLSSIASLFILLGIALLYGYSSTLNLAHMSQVLAARPNPSVAGFVALLFLAGFGLKAAIVPFHAWLPDAHPSAPAPISAMLSGVLVKLLGVYPMARIAFNVVGINAL